MNIKTTSSVEWALMHMTPFGVCAHLYFSLNQPVLYYEWVGWKLASCVNKPACYLHLSILGQPAPLYLCLAAGDQRDFWTTQHHCELQ